MKIPEKFLHLVWNHLIIDLSDLQTIHNEYVTIIKKGRYNFGQGPDFKDAVIQIGDIQWNGSVEIEINSKHWYLHQHHLNPEFSNVILLICYEHTENLKITNSKGWEIPILILKPWILKEAFFKLEILLQQEFPCKPFIHEFPKVLQKNLLTQKAIERLEDKVQEFKPLDLENVSWRMLWKAFGAPYHSELFLEISQILSSTYFFELTEKIQKEALVFGIAGFLNGQCKDEYFNELKEHWNFLKVKYSIQEVEPQFVNLKTRFYSYPHILMAQLVAWLHEHGNSLLHPDWHFFESWGEVSDYWKNHSFFGKLSKVKMGIGKQKMLKILLNWYFPYRWYYAKIYQPKEMEIFLEELARINKEENHLIRKMENWGWKIENGLESQGATQLYKKFCVEKRCLECALGQWYLKNEKEKPVKMT